MQTISKEALKYDLKEIEKLCKLAIGKRILNIELKKKKDEHNSVYLVVILEASKKRKNIDVFSLKSNQTLQLLIPDRLETQIINFNSKSILKR